MPIISKQSIGPKIQELRESIYLLKRNTLTTIALYVILAIALCAVLSPFVIPYPEHVSDEAFVANKFSPPSRKHLFGTDEIGRDVFSRVLYGTRVSVTTGMIAVGIAVLIGVPLGAVAGFFGGTTDEIIMRITDVFLSFPPLLLAIVLVSFLKPNLTNATLAISATWWPWYTRLVRGQAISLKERPFIRAAEAIGTPNHKIILRHILPNTISPVIVQASMDMGGVILTIASLSFLGLGAQPPIPEWGLMISISRNYFPEIWWGSLFPGVAIFVTVLAFNLLGDGLREILDPKTRAK